MHGTIVLVNGTVVTGNPLRADWKVEGLPPDQLVLITGPVGMGTPCLQGHMHGQTKLGRTTYGKELAPGNRLAIFGDGTEPAALDMIFLTLGLKRVQVIDCQEWLVQHALEMAADLQERGEPNFGALAKKRRGTQERMLFDVTMGFGSANNLTLKQLGLRPEDITDVHRNMRPWC